MTSLLRGNVGVRPVVSLVNGVYVDTNEHTGEGNDRFVLHKEEMPDSSEEGALEFSEVSWTSGKASTTISTNSVFTIEYQINSFEEGSWTRLENAGENVTLSNLNHGDIVYARLTDEVKTSSINSLDVEDAEKPKGEIILDSERVRMNDTITAKVNIQDNETRIARSNCKWVITNSSDELGENEDNYTGGVLATTTASVTSATVTLSITAPSIEGEYYIHVLLVDNAQNKTEIIKNVIVSNYTATEMVEYDAGEWTEEEIQALQGANLYNININKSSSNASGLMFTFGGFTYKNDTNSTNVEAINNRKITISRNASTASASGNISNMSDGWKVLEYGETVDNKKYVKSIIHAGAPENFVYYSGYLSGTEPQNGRQAIYILSSGTSYTSYNTYNPRNWDMYRDKTLEAKHYISEVHVMIGAEANKLSDNDKRKNGSNYWLTDKSYGWLPNVSTSNCYSNVYYVDTSGNISASHNGCYGIRPIVTFNDGVYIDTNEHTGSGLDKFILHKDGE